MAPVLPDLTSATAAAAAATLRAERDPMAVMRRLCAKWSAAEAQVDADVAARDAREEVRGAA